MATVSEHELKINERVTCTVDLPGVPAGTPGKVILRNGVTWKRYRVLFATDDRNGTDVGSLDPSVLVRIDKHGDPIVAAANA